MSEDAALAPWPAGHVQPLASLARSSAGAGDQAEMAHRALIKTGEAGRTHVGTDDPALTAALLAQRDKLTSRYGAGDFQEERLLLDATADVAAQSNVASLFEHVTDWTRRLLRADVVYLWSLDTNGRSCHLGATSGAVAAELRELHVQPGHGMTGRILETGMPLMVSHYPTGEQFSHDEQIDDVMAREGVQAAVGTPLIHSCTHGVLIAANRDRRVYTHDDVVRMRALADHAAIGVEKLQAMDTMAHTQQILEMDKREWQLRATAAERNSELFHTLASIVLTSADIDALIDCASENVRGHLTVFDARGRLLTSTNRQRDNDAATQQISEEVRRTHQLARGRNVFAEPILIAGRLEGVVCCRSGTAPDPATPVLEILRTVATVIGLQLMFSEAEAGAAGFNRDDFIDDLVCGDDTTSRLLLRGDRFRIDLRSSFTTHVVRAPLPQRRLAMIANDAARACEGLAGQCHALQRSRRPPIVALLPGTDANANSHLLAGAFEQGCGLMPTVGGAGPVTDLSKSCDAYLEALACTDALERIAGGQTAGSIDQLGFIGLVMGGKPDIERFIDRTLSAVLRYDAVHNTTLLDTLDALTATFGAPTAAADILHVHVSTVKQRVQRISALLGESWRTPDGLSELRIAIKLHRLRRR